MKKILLPLIIAVSVITGILIGNFYAMNKNRDVVRSIFRANNTNKISEVLNFIGNLYVDTLSLDRITERALPLIINELDPHSSYIPASDLQATNEELAGKFYGIGVQFNLQSDTIYIINVVSGGPSEKIGILAGDKIVSVNDSAFTGKKISNEKVINTLRGEKGTEVKLGIVRKGSDKILIFNVIRDEIPQKSIDIVYMVAPKIGYISVNKFGETTYKEFLNALAKVRHEGANALIVDLRGNAGGYMEMANQMLNEFLSRGDLIVYMEGAHQPRRDFYADGSGTFKNIKLAVLIDEFSGSASEIFAGAIQDNDRGTIVGRRSFGKGLVQQQVALSDNSALRITIARYYTPSGRCIQKPYKLGDKEDYQYELLTRFKHGEFYSQDSIQQNTSEEFKTRSGRTVYGGGGIMPDVFVPQDSTQHSPYFSNLISNGLVYKFALQYTENHRVELKKIKKWQDMQQHLERQNLFEKIIEFGDKNNTKGEKVINQKTKQNIEYHAIAYIIRNILDDEGFYPYYNQTDDCVQTAIKKLEK